MLESYVTERVVAVMAFNERLESTFTRHAKIAGNSYRIDPKADCLDEISDQLRQGCEAIRLTLDALSDEPAAKLRIGWSQRSFGRRFAAAEGPPQQKPAF